MFISADDKQSITNRIANLNWYLICLIIALASIGSIMLYSAAGGSFYPWLGRQLIHFLIFLPLMIIIAVTDIRLLFKTAYICYFAALLLLVIVAIKGYNSMGATRWFRFGGINIQPSELMKVCMVFALAKYFYKMEADNIGKNKYLIIPIFIIIVPTLLVFNQPDLGTAAILVMTGVVMLFIAGVKMINFIIVGIAGLIAIPFLWFFVLYDYQKNRILNFLNPNNDPSGSGYNIIQSKIAIGSGGLKGKGFLNGTQGQLDFLPERQTDFIFTMLAEELGFIGGVITIIIYSLIIYIGISMTLKIKHQFGRLLVMGIITIFFFHMFINIGMVMGLVPVVGAPLPLISYGGTITATMLIGFGLLLNADLYRNVDLSEL